MIQHHADHHPVHKQIQNAFTTVENGLKLYGTLRAGFEAGQAIFRGAQSVYQVAAPFAAALL
mgnify:CR=1 FL=1